MTRNLGARQSRQRIITPGAQRQMAEHANARITEVDASHVSMISQPAAIVAVILGAAATVV